MKVVVEGWRCRVEQLRRCAGGRRSGELGGQPEMPQDLLDHRALLDERDQAQAPPAARLIVDSITNDPDYNNGNYTKPLRSAQFSSVFFAFATNGGNQGQVPPDPREPGHRGSWNDK